jgi:hypothetical protein
MHQKQPPPNVADSVLFVFMELVGCASADKFSAPAASKKQIVCFIFPFAKFIPFQANPNVRPAVARRISQNAPGATARKSRARRRAICRGQSTGAVRTKRAMRPGQPVAFFLQTGHSIR